MIARIRYALSIRRRWKFSFREAWKMSSPSYPIRWSSK